MTQNTSLEVKLKDKTLSINGERIELDKSLFNATVTNKERTDYLELQYHTLDEELIEEDSDKIYAVLGNQKLGDITVSFCPEYEGHLAIGVYGNFNTQVN